MSEDDPEIELLSSADFRYAEKISDEELRRYVALEKAIQETSSSEKLVKLAGEIEEFLKGGNRGPNIKAVK